MAVHVTANENAMICTEFECDNLSPYVDSMLFDSGRMIARGVFVYSNDGVEIDKEITITLVVSGEVSVTYKGEVYHSPSEFPDKLIELIKRNSDWMTYAPSGEGNDEAEGDIYVTLNNWFEYTCNGDGELYEDDLSKATPEMILEDMKEIARQEFGINKEG